MVKGMEVPLPLSMHYRKEEGFQLLVSPHLSPSACVALHPHGSCNPGTKPSRYQENLQQWRGRIGRILPTVH